MAGQIIVETADINHLSERENSILELVRNWLLALIASDIFPVSERILAGKTLYTIGDSRFTTENWNLPNDPMLGFVEIEGGKFLFGKEGVETILDTFFMARYLTTIDQYNIFIDSSGYESTKVKGKIQGIGNEPVTGISWKDAVAYCDWLNNQLRNTENISVQLKGFLDQGGRIALPDELEWEKAAKGGINLFHQDGQVYSNPLPNRLFPWGDDFDINRANVSNNKIKAISPVGCFFVGSSPYGIQDLSGNVWEWTRSKFDPLEDDDKLRKHCVLRGGTCSVDIKQATCVTRARGNLTHGTKTKGFRIVLTKNLLNEIESA